MSAQLNYWKECIATAAEECDLKLTPEQLGHLTGSAKSGHDNYGMAFYSPPCSDRIIAIEHEYARKLKHLQDEFNAYRNNAETAVKKALRLNDDAHVEIRERGKVLRNDGRTEYIQL